MSGESSQMSDGPSQEELYRLQIPAFWQRFDRGVLTATRIFLFLIGALFSLMICLEVAARYLADFSIFFINGAAEALLVWFFLLGAGLALREGAHVGVELLVKAVSTRTRRVLISFAQAMALFFFGQMLWSGLLSLPASLEQTDAATGLTLFWVTLAFPVGFALLIYHQIAIVTSVFRTHRELAL